MIVVRILCSVLLLSIPLVASTISTPAQNASNGLLNALEIYSKNHKGALPKNWKELSEFFLNRESSPSPDGRPYILSALDGLAGAKLEDSFLLIPSDKAEMVTPNGNEIFSGGKIVAVTVNIISEDRHSDSGRYVIWRDSEEKFRASWLSEETVKAQFEKAQMKLPTGSVLEQPSALGADGEVAKYVQENFKDPKKPTAEEIEKMKAYFAEKYSDKPATESTSPQQQSTPLPATSTLRPSATVTPTLATVKPSSNFPVVPVVILAVAIVGAAVFLLRRRTP